MTTFSNVTPFSIKHFVLKKLCALSLYALHVVGWLHVVVVVKGFRTETSRDFKRLHANHYVNQEVTVQVTLYNQPTYTCIPRRGHDVKLEKDHDSPGRKS